MPTSITFKHGITTNELPTAIVPLTAVTSPTVVVGTAPIHLATSPVAANVPQLCSSLSEFVAQFGWSDDFASYTLCEAAKAHFTLYNITPVVFINVLDPLKHAKNATATITGLATPAKLPQPILLDSIKITSGEGDDEITLDADDFSAVRDGDGNTIITVTATNKIVNDTAVVSYRAVDATAVTAQTIVGGVDLLSGQNTGLEVIEDVYPRLGVVPGTIIAPKFSTDPAVALVMASKSTGINGVFKALAVADISTTAATKYTDITTVKNGNNLNDEFLVATWPKVALGGEQYHLSTQLAAMMGTIDAEHDQLPYKSPSNEFLQCDSSVLADGTEIYLGKDKANHINGNGVLTALNFGGFRSWGTHTSIYPNDTDPKNFIAVRRMWNYINNTLATNFFSKIDAPMTRVMIDAVLDSVRIWLNGLTARGALLGGDIAFLEEDNPASELTKGKITFRLKLGFVVPAVEIEFLSQFDVSYLQTLFTN